MLKDTFLHHMKKNKAFSVGDYSIFYNPPTILNLETDEETKFKNIDELYENGMLGDMKLKEFWESEEDVFKNPLCLAVIDDTDLWFPREGE